VVRLRRLDKVLKAILFEHRLRVSRREEHVHHRLEAAGRGQPGRQALRNPVAEVGDGEEEFVGHEASLRLGSTEFPGPDDLTAQIRARLRQLHALDFDRSTGRECHESLKRARIRLEPIGLGQPVIESEAQQRVEGQTCLAMEIARRRQARADQQLAPVEIRAHRLWHVARDDNPFRPLVGRSQAEPERTRITPVDQALDGEIEVGERRAVGMDVSSDVRSPAD